MSTYCPHCRQIQPPHAHRRVVILREKGRIVILLAPLVRTGNNTAAPCGRSPVSRPGALLAPLAARVDR
jgi:hypothetical protein